jgi:hypothetical protein
MVGIAIARRRSPSRVERGGGPRSTRSAGARALPPQRAGPIASASVRLGAGLRRSQRYGELRQDLALQTAVDRVATLANAPTLWRLEHWADRATEVALLRT